MRSRFALVEESTSAEEERIGAILHVLDRAVAAEQEHVVAHDLRVVGRVVAREPAFVVQALGLPFASIGRWQPPQLVVHERWQVWHSMLVVAVRALARGHVESPASARSCRSLPCATSLARAALGLYSVCFGFTLSLHQRHLPFPVGIEHGALVERAARHSKRLRPSGVRMRPMSVPPGRAAGPGGEERRVAVGGAVAVRAFDLDRRRDLAVEVPVAVRVLAEMAVDAVHADVEVYRREVHRSLRVRRIEPLRILVGDDIAVLVEQVALAVALVDRAEIPAVAVVVGELGIVSPD